MKLVPHGSVRRTAVLLACLALIGVYLVHTYLHAPRTAEVRSTEARLHRLLESGPQDEPAARMDTGELDRRLAYYEQLAGRLEALLPSSVEVPALMEAIAREQRRAGVEMTMFRPESPEATEPFEQWTYQLAVKGNYHAIASFVAAIGSLNRIVAADDMVVAAESVTPDAAAGGHTNAVASFRLRLRVRNPRGTGNPGPNEGMRGSET